MQIRRLTEREVELKPCQIAKDLKWVQLLSYKTARADQAVLDETFGLNWKSDFKEIGGVLYCTISVYNPETKEWISRTDAGDTGNDICVEKSQASSAFKRAATQFGIGRFLYNSPTIFINLEEGDCGKDGKLKQKFYVKEMEIDEKDEFTKLVIVDGKGKERWTLKGQKQANTASYTPKAVNPQPEAKKLPTEEEIRAFVTPIYNDYKTKGDTMKAETVAAFARCYIGKLPTWKGEMDINRLYQSWMNRS